MSATKKRSWRLTYPQPQSISKCFELCMAGFISSGENGTSEIIVSISSDTNEAKALKYLDNLQNNEVKVEEL